jgi:hypothetical protein
MPDYFAAGVGRIPVREGEWEPPEEPERSVWDDEEYFFSEEEGADNSPLAREGRRVEYERTKRR